MSNYEAFYWMVFGDGLNRLRCAAQVFFGLVASLVLYFYGADASVFMCVPLLCYIFALYTRSKKTKTIFGLKSYPLYGTFKIVVFIWSLGFLCMAKSGHISIVVAYLFELLLITIYATAMLQTGIFGTRIHRETLDTAYETYFGRMNEDDLKARERLFKK